MDNFDTERMETLSRFVLSNFKKSVLKYSETNTGGRSQEKFINDVETKLAQKKQVRDQAKIDEAVAKARPQGFLARFV